MSQKKVPPKLRDLVVSLSAEGLVSDAIAEKLNTEHGLEVSGRAIRRILQEHRDELADVAKGVARDELRKHLLSCVKVIVGCAVRAGAIEKGATAEPDVALRAQDRQMKAAAMLLHFAGLDQPDHPEAQPDMRASTDARQALLKRVQDLVDKVGAKDPQVH